MSEASGGGWFCVVKNGWYQVTESINRCYKSLCQSVCGVIEDRFPVVADYILEKSSTIFLIVVASLLINILALAFPLTLLQVYDRIIPNESRDTLWLLAFGIVVIISIETYLKCLRAYLVTWSDAQFEHWIGKKSFESILHSEIINYEKSGPGVHLDRFNSIYSLKDFYLGQLLISMVDIPFLFLWLFLICYIGGWIVLIPIVFFLVLVGTSIKEGLRTRWILKHRRTDDDRQMNFIIETLEKIHTVKSQALEKQLLRRYEKLQSSNAVSNYAISQSNNNVSTILMVCNQLTTVCIVSFGAIFVIEGSLTVGGLVACTLISGRAFQAIGQIIGLWLRTQTVLMSQDKINELVNIPREEEKQIKLLPNINGEIKFESVSFSYQGYSIIEKASFEIKDKECVLLVDENNHGKSTILWMILGILKAEEGIIKIGGNDLGSHDLLSLRKQVSFFPQHVKLFRGSIIENMTIFQEDKEEIAKNIARKIGLSSAIEKMANGYQTIISQNASEFLPKGIQQQIAIVRSLIERPKIILFDEANAAMDFSNDFKLEKVLSGLKGEVTIVIASHRNTFDDLVDRKLFLKDKRIINEH